MNEVAKILADLKSTDRLARDFTVGGKVLLKAGQMLGPTGAANVVAIARRSGIEQVFVIGEPPPPPKAVNPKIATFQQSSSAVSMLADWALVGGFANSEVRRIFQTNEKLVLMDAYISPDHAEGAALERKLMFAGFSDALQPVVFQAAGYEVDCLEDFIEKFIIEPLLNDEGVIKYLSAMRKIGISQTLAHGYAVGLLNTLITMELDYAETGALRMTLTKENSHLAKLGITVTDSRSKVSAKDTEARITVRTSNVYCDAARAGILADVGNLAIPPAQLKKGSIDRESEEFVPFLEHPLRGFEILTQARMPAEAEVALMHHRRFNNEGYPDTYRDPVSQATVALRTRRMSPLAELTAITDVFSAMTEHRAYRNGRDPLSPKDAIRPLVQEISRGADIRGTQSARYIESLFRLAHKNFSYKN